MLGSPLKRLKAFGNGIRKALEEQQLLEETHCKVETESNGPDNHIIYLSGGSGRDKALFAQCVNEFFDVIDNQRYILVKKKGHKGLNGFYAIPNCFSKKKEDAERFAKCMHPYIGNYDCVYTRNEKRKGTSVRRQGEGTCQSGGAVHFPQKSKRGVRVENILTTKYKKFVEFKI